MAMLERTRESRGQGPILIWEERPTGNLDENEMEGQALHLFNSPRISPPLATVGYTVIPLLSIKRSALLARTPVHVIFHSFWTRNCGSDSIIDINENRGKNPEEFVINRG